MEEENYLLLSLKKKMSKDSDGDGIEDKSDLCPDQKERLTSMVAPTRMATVWLIFKTIARA